MNKPRLIPHKPLLTFCLSLLLAGGPAFAQTWLLNPGSGNWNTAANWTPATVPNSSGATATFGLSNMITVSLSANTQVSSITFSASATSAYTITVPPGANTNTALTISGPGIINHSGVTENFVTTVNSDDKFGSIIFDNSATAGALTQFTNDPSTSSDASPGGVTFNNNSSAGSATFINTGGGVANALGGETIFDNSATAANGTFVNDGATFGTGTSGGQTFFTNGSSASHATITNTGATVSGGEGSGSTTFQGTSTAASANITNAGGTVNGLTGGQLVFGGTATAGSAIIINNGGTVNGASGGGITFYSGTTAGSATITNNGGTVTGASGGQIIFNSSTAGSATITTNGGTGGGGGGVTYFEATAQGGTARAITNGNGVFDISALSNAGLTIGSIEGSGSYKLGSKTLTVGGNNLSTAVTGVISDGGQSGGTGGALVKTGTGTLTLSGANTYTGATTVSAGTLQVGNGTTGNLTTSAVTVSGTAMLVTDLGTGSTFTPNIDLSASGNSLKAIQSGSNIFTGVISGAGLFDQNGTGTTILTNTETYTGATNVNAGILEVNGSLVAASTVTVATAGTLTGMGTIHGKATLTGNGIIDFASGGDIAGTLVVTGGNWNGLGTVGGLVTSSSGVFNLGPGADLTATAGLNVTGGTLAGPGTLTGNLNYTSSSSSTFAGVIAGTGATLTMNHASSTLILAGSNTYTGATTVSAGTLQVGNDTTGNLTSTHITVSGSGSLVLDLGAASDTFPNSTVNLSAGSTTLKVIQSGTTTIDASISGPGVFDQNGGGTTVLSNLGTYAYSGATNVNAGTLEIDGTLGAASTVNVGTAGTLTGTGVIQGKATLAGNSIIDLGTNGEINGTLTATGGNWKGVGTVGGLVTSSSGTLNLAGTLTAASGLAVTGGMLAGSGTLTGNLSYTSSASSTFGGVIAGAGATLTLNNGSSTLTLTGTNTYTGVTTISAGTLQVGDYTTSDLSGTSGVTVSGSGVLALDIFTGLTFAPKIDLSASGTALKAIQTGTTTISGVISGSGVFDQNGGTSILSNTETYTGATNVNAGDLEVDGSLAAASTVNVGAAGALSGAGTIHGKATLTGHGIIDFAAGGDIAGTLVVTGGNWNGLGTVGGLVTSSSGVFSLGSGADLTATAGLNVTGGTLAGTGTLTGNLNYTSSSSSTFAGVAAGTGAKLTMNNASSTLTLTATNIYTGATTVSAGILQVGNGTTGSLADTSAVTVSGSGILALDLATGSTFAPSIDLSAAGTALKAIQLGTTTFSGVISGPGVLDQNGAGTTVLSNSEMYTGATNVNAGILEVSDALAAASTVNVGAAGALSGAGTIHGKATLTGNGIIDFAAGGDIAGTLVVTGGNWNGLGTVGGLVTSSSGVFSLGSGADLTATAGLNVTGGTLAGAGTLTGNLNYTSSSSSTFAGVIAGTGATLTMNHASSTLTLTATNTYTGATTVSAGSLQVGNGTTGSLADTSAVTVSGSGILALDLADTSSFLPNVNLSASSAIIKTIQSGTNTLSRVISGTGMFEQNGTGTTVLTGADTYSGATTVSNGTLQLGTTGTAGSLNAASAMSLTNSATFSLVNETGNVFANNVSSAASSYGYLQIDSANTITLSGKVTNGAGQLELDQMGSGTTILTNAANTYTAATAVTDGTLQIGSAGTPGSIGATSAVFVTVGTFSIVNVVGNTFVNNVENDYGGVGTLLVNSANTNTLSGVLSDGGAGQLALTQSGSGKTILTKAETYTGATNVNAGALEVNGSLAVGSAVTVANTGTLGGRGTIAGAVTLDSGGTIAPGVGSPGVAGTTLHAASLLWNGGGTLTLQLGTTGDELALAGALTKGSAGTYTVDITDAGITATTYTLATFASTTFTLSNFTLDLPAGAVGNLMETSTSLSLVLTHAELPVFQGDEGGELIVSGDSEGTPAEMISSGDLTTHNSDLSPSLSITPTPEPGSAALLAFGAGTLLGWRRRRRDL